jgi:hypothetical protein
MKELYVAYKKFDSFIKMQLVIIFVISLSWALIMPIITKLQGLLWATSIISSFLILQQLTAFISPLFKDLHLRTAYRNLIFLDFLYLISLYTYFIDPLVFLYTEGILMLIYTIIMSVFGIRYDAFLMNKYNTQIFEYVQYVERISVATAAIIGYSVVLLLDIFTHDLSMVIFVFTVILSINLCFQMYNYIYYWKKLNIGD